MSELRNEQGIPAFWEHLFVYGKGRGRMLSAALAAIGLLGVSGQIYASEGIIFEDIADDGDMGIDFERFPSENEPLAEAFKALGTVTIDDFVGPYPIKARGAPGVAILDYDGDGDRDIYVTNGIYADNALFSNQLRETGLLEFVDLAGSVGLAAWDQDSTGICYGDIDNDGDVDVYVLGAGEPNRLFENNGAGIFTDITQSSGAGGGDLSAVSCSMGDVNGDGLLDIVIANNFDMSSSLAIFAVPFALNQLDQLLVNTGGNTFVDVSASAGLHNVQEITWAVAMVDIDQDGDTDIVTASDNGGIPFASMGGVDRGYVRVRLNDGTGHFTDVTSGDLFTPGDWMGLSFADFDGNGTIDIFASNTGDYFEAFLDLPVELGDQTTRWFLQNSDGSFSDPGVGAMVASVFGWGTGAFDYDNDGDTDIVYIGGLDPGPLLDLSNPGALLDNDGAANFSLNTDAFPAGVAADHSLRSEHGLAVGDLNDDGFFDIVTISNFNVLPGTPPLAPTLYTDARPDLTFGSPFDSLARFFPSFIPDPAVPGQFNFSGVSFPNGTLSVELNSADNGNRWVKVRTLGTVDLTSGGAVNRDGIGAVVQFTPKQGTAALKPILGGSSYASQHSLEIGFGLGSAKKGTLEVLWPGGVRNKLFRVKRGERVLFPEIPCSYDAAWGSFYEYFWCVKESLIELGDAGVLNKKQRKRFLLSAVLAFFQAQSGHIVEFDDE